MNPNQIRTLKPGQMPKASEWNALVRSAQAMNPRHNGYTTPTGHADKRENIHIRKSTLFYTESAIPAYSIFPVILKRDTVNGTLPVLEARQFSLSEQDSYLTGYIGTNGRNAIPANTYFYGYLIDEKWDDIVSISDFSDERRCGFLDGSFEASVTGTGLWITREFDAERNLYFVRKEQVAEADGAILAMITGGTAETGYTADFYANGKDELSTGSGLVFMDEIAFGAELKTNSWCVVHAVQTQLTGGNDSVD